MKLLAVDRKHGMGRETVPPTSTVDSPPVDNRTSVEKLLLFPCALSVDMTRRSLPDAHTDLHTGELGPVLC